ncbi:MAG: hypothetical protein NZ742_05405 [Acidobacteria bacterium]|nr:hypothetical protein [Acidobacteriota bacterium]MDW7984498.1 cytochrome c3 family protein [Acidobacteriota bacterium]
MKRLHWATTVGLALVTALAFVASWGGPSLAQIVGSKHDLRSYPNLPTPATQYLCVYCHTPHHSSQDPRVWMTPYQNYLWSRAVRQTAYIVYDATYTDPIAGNTAHTYMCMSCHDGTTTAIGQFLNPPHDYNGSQDNVYVTGDDDLTEQEGVMELQNDHPIDLRYATPPLPSTDYYSAAEIKAGGLKLFTFSGNLDVMTCATCHDPHNKNAVGPLIRVVTTGRGLCRTCHNL